MNVYANALHANLKMENIKGVIFDYGGTIDSRGDHWSEVIDRAYKAAGIEIGCEEFREAYVYAERALAKERIILPGDNFLDLMLKKINIEIGRLVENGVLPETSLSDGTVERIARFCYDSAARCVAEARPVLEALASRYPMVLVSNFYGNVEEVIRDFGIRDCFRGIIESAVVGVRKPDARIFMLGVVALGFKPEEVLVVGDSMRKDIEPARSIGCQVAWIKGKGWTDEEDAITDQAQIAGLTDLLGILA